LDNLNLFIANNFFACNAFFHVPAAHQGTGQPKFHPPNWKIRTVSGGGISYKTRPIPNSFIAKVANPKTKVAPVLERLLFLELTVGIFYSLYYFRAQKASETTIYP